MIRSIVVLVVMVLINIALVFAIIRLVKRTDDNLKKFFLDNSSKIFTNENSQTIENNNEDSTVEIIKKTEKEYLVNDIDEATYKNSNFTDDYKNVKEEMNFDRNDIILEVIENAEDSNDKYSKAITMISQDFAFDTIFELSTVSIDKQIAILRDVFDETQNKFLLSYLQGLGENRFDIATFFNYVKEQAKLIDENFYVKTGSKEEYYDDLNENVVTVHDENITEGIKVVHKNKMYDYSI